MFRVGLFTPCVQKERRHIYGINKTKDEAIAFDLVVVDSSYSFTVSLLFIILKTFMPFSLYKCIIC